MSRQLYQSQYILNKCFENKQNILRASFNNSQDFLNAVFDTSKGALRINLDNGFLPSVHGTDEMPQDAKPGQICPVLNEENGSIDFYEWKDGKWEYRGGTGEGGGGGGTVIPEDQQEALEWVTENLNELKEIADLNYIVNVEDIQISKDSTVIVVQGQTQDIDDDLDGDDDVSTPYRIDIAGYVLNVSTYSDADAIVPDRYYTTVTYESTTGGLGSSHIYLRQDEYDYFAGLPNGKNIIRVFYLTNAPTSPVKKRRYVLNPNGTATDEDGNTFSIIDVEDTDGDQTTPYCIDIEGYAIGTETYSSSEALIPDKYYGKMVYESDGIHSGKSHIYMEADEYDYFASLENGKNILDIYYVSTIFPASVIINEVQLKFPGDSVGYVAIDASGNPHNVEDTLDKDGDPITHVKITVNGYAIDMDGYYNSSDKIKKRLLVKMSYNTGIDTTDIYMDKDYYDHVSSLSNGRNTVSIYSVCAGIGLDASRIQHIDNSLDATSERAIQNKAVYQVISALQEEIASLKERIAELEQ